MLAEIEDFTEGFNQRTGGMRINGQRIATWSSPHGWLGIAGPRRSGYSEPLQKWSMRVMKTQRKRRPGSRYPPQLLST
jgi:hypothetical protein